MEETERVLSVGPSRLHVAGWLAGRHEIRQRPNPSPVLIKKRCQLGASRSASTFPQCASLVWSGFLPISQSSGGWRLYGTSLATDVVRTLPALRDLTTAYLMYDSSLPTPPCLMALRWSLGWAESSVRCGRCRISVHARPAPMPAFESCRYCTAYVVYQVHRTAEQ